MQQLAWILTVHMTRPDLTEPSFLCSDLIILHLGTNSDVSSSLRNCTNELCSWSSNQWISIASDPPSSTPTLSHLCPQKVTCGLGHGEPPQSRAQQNRYGSPAWALQILPLSPLEWNCTNSSVFWTLLIRTSNFAKHLSTCFKIGTCFRPSLFSKAHVSV